MRTLTIRNVPDALYELLETEAGRNQRTLSEEALLWLRRGLDLDSPAEIEIAQMREFRSRLPRKFEATIEEIDTWKREGRS